MEEIDLFLREMLINWALEEIHHPIKRKTLEVMSKDGWVHQLYKEEKKQDFVTISGKTYVVKSPEEEWLQKVLKEIFYETKKELGHYFFQKKWEMKRVETTGMYKFGPVNDDVRFHIGFKDGILFWDMSNFRGKIHPPQFAGYPTYIYRAVKRLGHDFLIRKTSKGFARYEITGSKSRYLFELLVAMKHEGIKTMSDAHKNLYIADDKKRKKYRLIPIWNEQELGWEIADKENTETITTFTDKKDIELLKNELTLLI